MTKEEIAALYARSLQEAKAITDGMPSDFRPKYEWKKCLESNKNTLEHTLKKDCWTSEDLAPLQDAIKKAEEELKSL